MKMFTFGYAIGDALVTGASASASPKPSAADIETARKAITNWRPSIKAISYTGTQPDGAMKFVVIHAPANNKALYLASKVPGGWSIEWGGHVAEMAEGISKSTASVGLIFDKALDNASFTEPRPSKYTTVVYRQRQKRISGNKFWDQENDFTENSADEAANKAKAYIASKGWTLIPYG